MPIEIKAPTYQTSVKPEEAGDGHRDGNHDENNDEAD